MWIAEQLALNTGARRLTYANLERLVQEKKLPFNLIGQVVQLELSNGRVINAVICSNYPFEPMGYLSQQISRKPTAQDYIRAEMKCRVLQGRITDCHRLGYFQRTGNAINRNSMYETYQITMR